MLVVEVRAATGPAMSAARMRVASTLELCTDAYSEVRTLSSRRAAKHPYKKESVTSAVATPRHRPVAAPFVRRPASPKDAASRWG